MKKYRFDEFPFWKKYRYDPVFGYDKFKMFGNIASVDSPIYFEANGYHYVLAKPCEKKEENWWLMLKTSLYLFNHPESIDGQPVIYFLGDLNLCKEISAEFEN